MDIINSIIATIKGMFTADQWRRIMEWVLGLANTIISSALEVVLVAVLVLGTTIAFKIVFTHSPKLPNPTERYAQLVMLGAAGVWSFLMLDGQPYDEKAAIAIVAWLLVWAGITFGGGLLETYQPKLWAAISGDRRVNDSPLPIEVPQDRRKKEIK
jgi:hypothetical protein